MYREHRDFIKRSHRRLKDFDVDRRHNDEFPRWFNSHVSTNNLHVFNFQFSCFQFLILC